MAEQSPTDNGNVQDSSGSRNEPQLEEDTSKSADEQQTDNDSGEQHSSDSDSGSSSNNNDDDQSSDDDGLAKFAKGQGYEDISDFTERELELLRRQKKQVDKYRNDPERIKSKDELKDATQTINDPSQIKDDGSLSPEQKREIARDMKIAQLEASQRTNDFYRRNPEAAEYDKEMSEIVLEAKEKRGIEAARFIADDLDSLFVLAKARRGNDDSAAAREAGRREERELLRKRQEGSADSSHSTTTTTPKSPVNRAWLESEYDPSNAEHRQMVDEALARGDLY